METGVLLTLGGEGVGPSIAGAWQHIVHKIPRLRPIMYVCSPNHGQSKPCCLLYIRSIILGLQNTCALPPAVEGVEENVLSWSLIFELSSVLGAAFLR